MKFLRLATLTAATLLGVGATVGGDGASADEIYSMAKFTLCKLPGHPNEYISVTASTAFSEDGARVAIASDNRTVHVCETAGNQIVSLAVPSSLAEDDDYINHLALSPDGTRLATASKEKMLRLWDVTSARELAALEHPSMLYFATFSPDGSRLISSVGDGKLWLWDVPTGSEIAVLEHPSRVASAVFSPDGARLAAASVGGTVHLWNAADGGKITVLSGHTEAVHEARFSADGKHLVTASEDSTARIWDAASGLGLLVLRHTSPVFSAAFSADGTRIVTGAGNEAHIFDAALGREVAVLKGHEYDVNDASFSPDGTRIVTASGDNSVRVWDAGAGAEIAKMTGHLGGATSATFTPDGARIVTLGGPVGLVFTKLPPGSLPDTAAGLWFQDFGTPEQPLPEEIVRSACVSSPVRIGGDGLIVFFEQYGGDEPPQAIMHMRCAADLTCQIFAEAPAQGLEAQGAGTIKFAEEKGDLCLAGECRPIARCPELVWTDEERSSGFAEQWETHVLAPGK